MGITGDYPQICQKGVVQRKTLYLFSSIWKGREFVYE